MNSVLKKSISLSFVALYLGLSATVALAETLNSNDIEVIRARVCTGEIKSKEEAALSLKLCDSETLNNLYLEVAEAREEIDNTQNQIEKLKALSPDFDKDSMTAGYLSFNRSVLYAGVLPGSLFSVFIGNGVYQEYRNNRWKNISFKQTLKMNKFDLKLAGAGLSLPVMMLLGAREFDKVESKIRVRLKLDDIEKLERNLAYLNQELGHKQKVIEYMLQSKK